MSNTDKTTGHAGEIAALLRQLYEPADALQWLHLPQTLLKGDVPAVLIRAGRGGEVAALLRQITEGVYV